MTLQFIPNFIPTKSLYIDKKRFDAALFVKAKYSVTIKYMIKFYFSKIQHYTVIKINEPQLHTKI